MTKYNKIILLAILVLTSGLLPSTTYAQDPDETYIIGNLNWFGNDAFAQEMASLGYVEGENITYLYINYEDYGEDTTQEEWQQSYERQIQAMLDAGADLFVINTDSDAVRLQPLVGNTPIIFARADDPVATGAVESLINPGGNITGIVTNRPHERRLQVLTEILPSTDKVYYLYSPLTMESETVLEQVLAVATGLGVEVIPASISDSEAGTEALNNIPDGTDWLFLTPNLSVLYDRTDAGVPDRLWSESGRHRPPGCPDSRPHFARRRPRRLANSNGGKLLVGKPGGSRSH
jgi:hypothetical protein